RDEARRVARVVDGQDVIAIGTAVGTVCRRNAAAVARPTPPAARGSRQHLMMVMAMAASIASGCIIAEVMVLGQLHVPGEPPAVRTGRKQPQQAVAIGR